MSSSSEAGHILRSLHHHVLVQEQSHRDFCCSSRMVPGNGRDEPNALAHPRVWTIARQAVKRQSPGSWSLCLARTRGGLPTCVLARF